MSAHTSASGIYALACPETGKVMYVGQAKNIRTRYQQHCATRRAKNPKDKWVMELKEAGKLPTLVVLEQTESRDCQEKKWIASFPKGSLYNIHVGGKYQGIDDPKPWRVAGISYPSKLLSMGIRNMGGDESVVRDIQSKARSLKTDNERLSFELMVADTLSKTRFADKIESWLSVVLPRIEKNHREIIHG